MTVNGSLYWYDNGSLSIIETELDLKLPGMALGSQPIVVHEAIYSTAHKLMWPALSTHSDLNDILSTLSRQKQVLEAMGVQSGPHETFDRNVVESKENVLGNALFAFLFGGHVASGFEL